jgi:(1->4)-alpha-D-glucan 1-alpha-D-glucosylmutase
VRELLAEDDLHLLEFQSIITAFERLPPQDERDPDLVAERRREQVVAKRRLADLVADSPEVARAIEETVRVLNGDTTDPHGQAHGFDALDRLLDAQSYRLSSFRTAGEEINYRRFFAINELAAVRQEEPEVFAAAHALLLRLIAGGAVTGLRIDHPDGLWDPAGYFRDLQRAAWTVVNDPLIPDATRFAGTRPLGAGRREQAPSTVFDARGGWGESKRWETG